jgi:aminoglycoside/choline kinase family phosphotransferase
MPPDYAAQPFCAVEKPFAGRGGMTGRAQQLADFVGQHVEFPELFPLAGDASFRRYIRIKHAAGSYMLMDAPPVKEDITPFMTICNHLHEAGFSAPRMIASDAAQGFLLLEDLGDDTFSRLLRADISREEDYYAAAVDVLAAWHNGAMPADHLPPYDNELLMREIGLFSNWFLPQLLDGDVLAAAQASYEALWSGLLAVAPLATDQFVHRDYHADNLMWLPARVDVQRVGLLDFQDAVAGDAAYDLVSLLEDARRDVPAALASTMIARYLKKTGVDAERFSFAYALLAAQRNSKIVGIFTRLAARDGKAHYLDFLPRVWGHLSRDAEHPALGALKSWLQTYVPEEKRGVIAIRKDARQLGLAA